jgi:hypothetical protein
MAQTTDNAPKGEDKKPPINQPKAKEHGGAEEPTKEETLITGIEKVTSKSGETNDRKWVAYFVHAGEIYGTFDTNFAAIADNAAANGIVVAITWKQGKKGREIVNIVPQETEAK